MVVKKRLRAVLIPLALYGVSGLAVGYFVHHAQSGQRGLDAKRELQVERERIAATLDALARERADWQHRIALVRAEQIDRDLLEEQARLMLGRVHANDVVIMLGPAADVPPERGETSIN
ncbi:FtsB family cell division protein [Salinarimonas sp. NSM]|uniref:FtsB family cell division protein n=1 Tax=Salinarimonas sp. NSM TaxID=3458003 RepID=UPI0040352B64